MFISSCDFGLLHVKSMLILCQIISLPQSFTPPPHKRKMRAYRVGVSWVLSGRGDGARGYGRRGVRSCPRCAPHGACDTVST